MGAERAYKILDVVIHETLDNEEGNAAVWTSPDGFTWSRVPHDEAVFGGAGEQKMVSVTGGGLGLVAVGYDSPGRRVPGVRPADDRWGTAS